MSFLINAVDAEMPESAICENCKDKELLYRETEARGQGNRIFNPSKKTPNAILTQKGKTEQIKKKKKRKESGQKERTFTKLKGRKN